MCLSNPDRKTILSPCRTYRYVLWRELHQEQNSEFVMFIGLNPSTADEVEDDPTIRRCKAFTQKWGFHALCMTNLFAFRSPKPADLRQHHEPVGPENNQWLLKLSKKASLIVAAWGNVGQFMGRSDQIIHLIPNLYCLGTTKLGHPRHPLYVKGETSPIRYRAIKVAPRASIES